MLLKEANMPLEEVLKKFTVRIFILFLYFDIITNFKTKYFECLAVMFIIFVFF